MTGARGPTIGIEEEYIIVDRESREIVREPPDALLATCQAKARGQVHPEFLRCQIEVGTRVTSSIAEARAELARLRHTIATVAEGYEVAAIAASTHPFGTWLSLNPSMRERYLTLARELGAPVRRLMICGMHVHVGMPDDDLRIDIMNQARYFLPHLLALSTSSPFWQGRETGLKSYRLAVLSEIPRTGMPEAYTSFAEYQQQLKALVDAGVIEDGTKLWWDIRPNARFPTLEMRITDVCTRLDDAIAVAALYVCLIGMLLRLRRGNIAWRGYKNLLIEENRWRAQRYGIDEGLIDYGRGRTVPYRDLLEEILELVRPEAEAYGCLAEVASARTILERGTSAHRQLAIYRDARADGATEREALDGVVDWLIAETVHGITSPAPDPLAAGAPR